MSQRKTLISIFSFEAAQEFKGISNMSSRNISSFTSGKQFSEQVMHVIAHKHLDKYKPVAFSFYLVFESEQDANSVSEELAADGFYVDVEPSSENGQWLCWGNTSITPNEIKLERLANTMLKRMELFHGEIQRWETNPFYSGQELGQLMAVFEQQFLSEQLSAA